MFFKILFGILLPVIGTTLGGALGAVFCKRIRSKIEGGILCFAGGVMIAAHLGGQSQWDEVEKYLVGENIYLDTSMGQKLYPKEQFLRIARTHGADKILFGTDSPWSCAKDEVDLMKKVSLTDEEKELILSGNAKRLLSL